MASTDSSMDVESCLDKSSLSKILTYDVQPDSHVSFALFTEVENMKEVRKCVMNGEFEAALLKTSMIQNQFQVITAANKAIHQRQNKKMITKNIHSEILFCLSPLKGISDSFRKFGVSDDDRTVFVAIVDDKHQKVLKQIAEKVQGKLHNMTDLENLCDVGNIKKIYKVTDEEMQVGPLVDALVTRISMKEIFAV